MAKTAKMAALAADDEGHTTDVQVMQEVACTRSKVKLGCDICDHLEEVINQLMDLPHKSNSLSKEAHAADDEGHTTDVQVMQEVACTRSKVKLGCDICDHLEEVINQLMDLPHKSNSLSKEAEAPDNDLYNADLPIGQEESCSASKDRIMCETVSKLEKAIEEMDNLECEHDNLNKEAHAADDEGHTTDIPVVQEAPCIRHKVELSRDIYGSLEERIPRLMGLPFKSNEVSKEAEALDNYLYNADLPIGQEESCSASKDRIMCETVSKLEKAIEEMDNLECEHDNLNKEAHAADDEGHTTDIPVVQEAPCIRHKVELSRDIYGSLEERIPRLMGLPFKSNEVSKEAEDLVNIFNTPEMPAVQEESFSASKDRIMCEAASNLEKAVEEFNKLESEHDSLNKKKGAIIKNLLAVCSVGLFMWASIRSLQAIKP